MEAGDSFYPLGMKGSKKISDFFTDKKIPVPLKKKIWLLTSEGEIVWSSATVSTIGTGLPKKQKTFYTLNIFLPNTSDSDHLIPKQRSFFSLAKLNIKRVTDI
jgi:tRNA(Ile)-lysidine synthetase-like protein